MPQGRFAPNPYLIVHVLALGHGEKRFVRFIHGGAIELGGIHEAWLFQTPPIAWSHAAQGSMGNPLVDCLTLETVAVPAGQRFGPAPG